MYLQRTQESGGEGKGRAPHTKQTIVTQAPGSTAVGGGPISPIAGLLGVILKFPGPLAFLPDNINSSVPPRGRSWEGRAADAFQARASGDKVRTRTLCAASWAGEGRRGGGVGLGLGFAPLNP